MRVSAPGSTANIGPGFDVMALAIGLRFELSSEPGDGYEPVAADDLVWAALSRAGVTFGELWSRSEIPVGRGLGSSAAAAVAAAYLGFRVSGSEAESARQAAFEVAAGLEGHQDNAAASAFGGLVLAAGDRIHTDLPASGAGRLRMWVPDAVSATPEARVRVPDSFVQADVVEQAAACAATYAGLLTGSPELLRHVADDRVHERQRLAELPDSRRVIGELRSEGHVAWLSGSGPSVAALVVESPGPPAPAAPGDWLSLSIDTVGCVEVD